MAALSGEVGSLSPGLVNDSYELIVTSDHDVSSMADLEAAFPFRYKTHAMISCMISCMILCHHNEGKLR
jgi:hypothetical protein